MKVLIENMHLGNSKIDYSSLEKKIAINIQISLMWTR